MGERKKRQVFSPEFKAKVGLEAIRGLKTVNELGQERATGMFSRFICFQTLSAL